MICRICAAKADAFGQAGFIAEGRDDGTAKDYRFVPSPNSRYLSQIYHNKAAMHTRAAMNHEDSFHDG